LLEFDWKYPKHIICEVRKLPFSRMQA